MQKTGSLAVQIGIFVVVGTLILTLFSIRTSRDFGGGGFYEIEAYFDDTLGLTDQADVSLSGVRIGKVKSVDFDPRRRAVKAVLAVSSDYPLPTDSTARIQQAALLGTSIVVIRYGQESGMLSKGGEIATESVPGLDELVTSVSEMSADARDLVSSFKENQDGLFGRIESVIEENREDLRKTSESFAQTGPKLELLADNLNEITENMKSGKGTIGRLYSDETLYEDLKSFSTDAKQIVADLRDGDGTLSRLLYDDSLAREAEDGFRKLGEAGDEVKAVLGDNEEEIREALAALRDVGPRMDRALDDLQEITRKINEGEGTLGRLVNDPSLYEDAQRTVNQVGESFEASEEQGVVRSFIGVLFGALI